MFLESGFPHYIQFLSSEIPVVNNLPTWMDIS